jgi:ribonuclease Z
MRGRNMSAQVVKLNTEYLLIDCGEGTQYQLLRYHIPHSKINHILISHLHGDHFFGLVALVSTMNMLGRKTPLHIYGPPGLDEILTIQFRYSDTILNYAMVFHVLKEDYSECIIDEENWEVHTIPLSHRIRCNGFLIKEKPKRHRLHKPSLPKRITLAEIAQIKQGKNVCNEEGDIIYHAEDYLLPPHKSRSYAYCSDTCYYPDMFDIIHKVDVLYHESTFLDVMKNRAKETFHTTAREAAITASSIQCHTLIIGHFSSRYKELLPFLEEARAHFTNTFLGIEGTRISIDERNEVVEYVHVQA